MKKSHYIIEIILVCALIFLYLAKTRISIDEIKQVLNEHPEIIVEALQRYKKTEILNKNEQSFQLKETIESPLAVEIIEQYDCPDNLGHHVCGVISNNTNKPIHVMLRAIYYDANNIQVGIGNNFISVIDSFGKAQFKTTGSVEKFDHYKVEVER